MNEAVWYVIETVMYQVWGAFIVVHIIVALLIGILGAQRDRWRAISGRGVFTNEMLDNKK
jgi:hypothetical protein